MKRLLFLAIIAFCSCEQDPGSGTTLVDYSVPSYYRYRNNSQYTIMLKLPAFLFKNTPFDEIDFIAVLEPGETFEKLYQEGESPFSPQYFEEVAVSFVSETDKYDVIFGKQPGENGMVPTPTHYAPGYNLTCYDSYDFEEVRWSADEEKNLGGRWTHTFTYADFAAARAWVESHPEQFAE